MIGRGHGHPARLRIDRHGRRALPPSPGVVRPERPGRETVRREMSTLLLLLDAVKAGIERGELRRDLDPLVATNTLWAHIHGVTALAVAGLLVETAAGHQTEVLEATLAAALRGVVPG